MIHSVSYRHRHRLHTRLHLRRSSSISSWTPDCHHRRSIKGYCRARDRISEMISPRVAEDRPSTRHRQQEKTSPVDFPTDVDQVERICVNVFGVSFCLEVNECDEDNRVRWKEISHTCFCQNFKRFSFSYRGWFDFLRLHPRYFRLLKREAVKNNLLSAKFVHTSEAMCDLRGEWNSFVNNLIWST